MASLLDRILSYGPDTKVLTADQAGSSVVVSNIPPTTTAENIVIHFQRQKNGGGEIDHVHIPKEGTAVITFESSEVAEKVLKHSHKLEGSELKLQRFIPKQPLEVFQQVEARVNFSKLHLTPQESQDILDTLKENTEVAHRKGSKNLTILSGTFSQIEAAHKLLQFHITDKGKKGNFHYGGSSARKQSFEVQAQFMNLLTRLHETNLHNIEHDFGVKIVWGENASQVCIFPKKTSDEQNRFQEGCDAFIDLYQIFVPNVRREEVEIPNETSEALVREAVSFIQSENPVIVEKVNNNLVVYAEKSLISISVHVLKEKLGLTKDASSRKTRRGHGNKSRDAHEDDETQQEGRFKLPKRLNQVLNNGVNISLYQGDITDERVDAIVNAANEWLQHGAGVAGAIVSKGGREIQEESYWITNQQGPLKVGEAVYTSGGSLPCRKVIHTVGPRWKEHGREKSIFLLHQACMKSLLLAVQLELSSIALTAISSGIFGMPRSICAQVMFNAMEEFSSSRDAEFSTLRDVRIVIIDQPTISVFHEEFVKRYRSQETLPGAVTKEERPPDRERKTSLTTNTKNDNFQLECHGPFHSVDQTKNNAENLSYGKREQNEKVELSGKGDDRDEKNSDQSAVPDTQVSPSKRASENVKEADLPTSVKKTKGEENGTMHAPNDNDSAPVESFSKAFILTTTKLPFGRGRGKLAITFPGKETSIPSESMHLQENTADAAKKGTDIISKTATTTTSPPGLTVTKEGKNGKPEGELPEDVNEAEQTDPSNTYVQEDSQSNKQNVGGVDVNEEPKTKTTTDQKTSSQSNASKDNACGDNLPPGEQAVCTDLEAPLEGSASDESTKHRTVKNTENVMPERDESKEMQTHVHKEEVPGSVSNTRNDGVMSPQDPLVSGNTTKEIQAEIERSAQHASITSCPKLSSGYLTLPQSVNVVNGEARGETKDVESKTSQTSSTDPSPPNETHQSDLSSKPQCLMCMNLNKEPVYPSQCGRDHYYCKSCVKCPLEKTKICPQCEKEGFSQGNQPVGYMSWTTVKTCSLPGYEHCDVIVISFNFEDGIQGPEHPSPGQPYSGLLITAYLPCNKDGQQVCRLLKKAFEARLMFTIGKSPATGEENKIVFNGIELKTSQSGGPANYGYPDPSYLDRVKIQLAEKGIK